MPESSIAWASSRRTLPTVSIKLFPNPRVDRIGRYGAQRARILGGEAFDAARREITSWPGYAVTPLHDLRGLAAALGIGELRFKDEGSRFGLGSFKALGGAYAVGRLLAGVIARETGARVGTRELAAGAFRERVRDITVTCATDGNHGRSVAWAARMFGCKCVIYIHEHVSEGRKAAIERFGAEVVRTPGNYDDAVRQADADARRLGRHVISDTSYEGYMDVPRDVMQGYALMAEEALQQWDDAMPTHVFLQGGVGGMAAAVCGHFWERAGGERPMTVVVEPDKADCLLRSACAGVPVAVRGELDTMMAGLACGEVSLLAWEILREGADAFASLPDQAAIDCMRLLATAPFGDPRIVAGESAVAGLGALIGAAACPAQRESLGLDAGSRVLLFGTEGDTDPELYRQLVGASAAQISSGSTSSCQRA